MTDLPLGRAALESLYNSAVSVMEQAQSLVQVTKPDTPERARGIPATTRKVGRSTRTVAGVFGTEQLLAIVNGSWIEWRAATLVACESEALRKTVGEAITEVIIAGRELVNATVRAPRTMDPAWAECRERLNTATVELQGLFRLVPSDAGTVEPEYLLTLVRRLADQSGKIGRKGDWGEHAPGIAASEEKRCRKHTWGDEVRDCRKYDPTWLDPSLVESPTYTAQHQRALVTLFELQVAVAMLDDVTAADDVRAALATVAGQPYYTLKPAEEPRKKAKTRTARPAIEWHTLWRPIPAKVLKELLDACRVYADAVAERRASGQAAHGKDDFKPGHWFGKKMTPRLRMATGKARKNKRVRWKVIDGVKCYSVSDARRWWGEDVPAQ